MTSYPCEPPTNGSVAEPVRSSHFALGHRDRLRAILLQCALASLDIDQ